MRKVLMLLSLVGLTNCGPMTQEEADAMADALRDVGQSMDNYRANRPRDCTTTRNGQSYQTRCY